MNEVSNLQAEVESLKVNVAQQADRIRYLEKLIDTYLHSNILKRILFYVDGWPADRVASQPKPRLWRKWWTS